MEDSLENQEDNKTIEQKLQEGMIISFGHDNTDEFSELIQLISQKLVDSGYVSSTKSSFDEELKESIVEFQKKNKLNVTGVIDYELYLKIEKNKDIVVERSEHEKKTDAAATGEVYAVPEQEGVVDYHKGVWYSDEEKPSDIPIGDNEVQLEKDIGWAVVNKYQKTNGDISKVYLTLNNGERVEYDSESPNNALENTIKDLASKKFIGADDFAEGSLAKKIIDNKSVVPPIVPQGASNDFDVSKISSRSGVSAAMILAFVAGESQGNPNAKAFNGDNYCKCLGWSSSSDTESFLSGLESGGISGSSYINGKWVSKTRFGFKTDYETYKSKYKSKGYYFKSGYAYWDTAYFNAHKEGTDSQKAFDLAYSINPECAIRATAWGKVQVMGNHLIGTHPEVTNLNNGKEARDYFDSISMLASSEMYVSWVKNAGRFPKGGEFKRYANKYGIPEVLGARYIDVIGMAEDNPNQYGYFLFLTKKYYGGWDNHYASRLQKNFKKYLSINKNKVASERRKRIIKRSQELFKMKGSPRKDRAKFLKSLSRKK
jgi:hypothetical protein